MFEVKDAITVGISVVALITSALTLYLNRLRGPQISAHAGEHIYLGYFEEGNCQISLSVVLVNHGARVGSVQRLGLLVREPGSGEGYLLEPCAYQKLSSKGTDFVDEAVPGPLAIAGSQIITKQVLFRSSFERPDEFQLLVAGTYQFTLLGWSDTTDHPDLSSRFDLVISDDIVKRLKDHRKEEEVVLERLSQEKWRKWAAHRVTVFEVRQGLEALLGQNHGKGSA